MEYEKRAKKNPRVKQYDDACFLATHCISENEYEDLYKILNSKKLFLTKKELKAINGQLLHPSANDPLIQKWIPAIKNKKALQAFKIFVSYPSVRKLLEQNDRWSSNKNYKSLVDFLKS